MGILKNFEGDGHDNEHVNLLTNMNPLINTNHLSDSSSSSEDEEVHENTPVSAPSPTISIVPVVQNRTAKVKKASKSPKPMLHLKNIGGKKSRGHRQARRHENMCFLLNLAHELDEDFAEVKINDLVETTISVFAEILLNKNKMKIWNEFIELPEYQQEEIIKMATTKKDIHQEINKKQVKNDTTSDSDESFDSFVFIENHETQTTTDESIDLFNQQEEADTCFHRIDPHIRRTFKTMLKRHHIPLDRISCFEDDVIPFFKEHPDSVYLRDLKHGFDRMLLHAVCQYLNLISKSISKNGERYTQVENRRIEFVPPTMLLSEYVKLLDETKKTIL